jgi:hypothetical protein
MALTAIEKKQLRRVNEEAVKGMDGDAKDAYLDAIGADDGMALEAIAKYKARVLPQLLVQLDVDIARRQETQKKINLLNS